MPHTKSTRYIARNDYAAIVDGIEIGFSDTAFGAEIIANDYVSAQIELAARAADGAEGATTMNTYTIQTTGENLANNYGGFGAWEYKGRPNRVTTETYTVTIPAGQMAAFEQLLDSDDSVLSYTEIATPNIRGAIAEGDWSTVYDLVCAAGAVDFSQANGESNLGEWLAGGSYDGNETAEQLAADYAADDAWQMGSPNEA